MESRSVWAERRPCMQGTDEVGESRSPPRIPWTHLVALGCHATDFVKSGATKAVLSENYERDSFGEVFAVAEPDWRERLSSRRSWLVGRPVDSRPA